MKKKPKKDRVSWGVLKFPLPENEVEFQTAQKAGDYAIMLGEFGNHLRRKYKHADPPSDASIKELEEIRDEFHRLLEFYEIEVW